LSTSETETEKVYKGNVEIHQRLLSRFLTYDDDNKDKKDTQTMDYLIKLAGAIGYSQQVHAGLVKAYQHEKRLADIEKKLADLPPEILDKVLKEKGA